MLPYMLVDTLPAAARLPTMERLPVYQIVRKPYLCLEEKVATQGIIAFVNVRHRWTSYTFESTHGHIFRFNTIFGSWRYVGDDIEMQIPGFGIYVIHGVKTSA